MGNVLWRSEDSGDWNAYHKLASKNLTSFIEAEICSPEDDDRSEIAQAPLATSDMPVCTNANDKAQTSQITPGVEEWPGAENVRMSTRLTARMQPLATNAQIIRDAYCETPRGRRKRDWPHLEAPYLQNGKTKRFRSHIAQREINEFNGFLSTNGHITNSKTKGFLSKNTNSVEDEVDGCLNWELNGVETLKQGHNDDIFESSNFATNAEMKSTATEMASPTASRLQTLRSTMVQIDTEGKVNVSAENGMKKSPTQGSPIPKVIHPRDYDLPFENLVFEGGGNKGLAHCGALRYLEKIGIKGEKIKRVAGASAGSIFAALVAVGYTANEIEKEMREHNMKRMFLDGSWLGIVRNLIWHFGMHEATAIYNWLGAKLAEKAKSKMTKSKKCKPQDITFEQVYTHFGKELCVVVTNLNRMTTEYCHPKTTPRMPVREAVRMSTSLPGLFTAKQYELHGDTDVFVDGGVLCNYPIHCFDGWYLSMAPEDSLTQKLLEVENLHQLNQSRFESEYLSTNFRTLGISIFAEHEEDLLKHDLEKEHGRPDPVKPKTNTPLYMKWEEKNETRKKSSQFRVKREDAVKAFLEVLQQCPKDENNEINRVEIEKAIEEDPFLQKRKKEIFGVDPCVVFNAISPKKCGKIHYGKLIGELSDLDIQIQNRSLGCQRTIIDGFYSFLDRIQSTLLVNVKKSYVKITDAERTVGINTGHVETNSFDLEDDDKDFLIQRGENACRKYILRFIERHNIRLKTDQTPTRGSSTESDMSLD